MKAKIKVQSIQLQYYIKDAGSSKMEDTFVFWSIRKRYFLLSELNGIVYNFNANFAYYCPIIIKINPAQYQKFNF
jgi:hypothetical protein